MPLRSFTNPRHYFGITRQAEPSEAASAKSQRAPRRLLDGVALRAQKCRLLVTSAAGECTAYPCRVVDVANGGYCITLLGDARVPEVQGTLAMLEQTDKSQTPVELRWFEGARIGLKRLPRGRAG